MMPDIKTKTQIPPQIVQYFSRKLLSTPFFVFGADYLLMIANWLLQKIEHKQFHKLPSTVNKLKQKHLEFMELYERAKIKEKEAKGKTFIKVNQPFYRPRLANKDEQRIFERLDRRFQASKRAKWNNKVSKVW